MKQWSSMCKVCSNERYEAAQAQFLIGIETETVYVYWYSAGLVLVIFISQIIVDSY